MPSQLYDNKGVSFVCARNFTYNGEKYEIGQDFPQEDLVDSPEVLVRSRYLIPVVDSWEDKPRHWQREIRLKETVLAKLGRTGESLLNKEERVAALDDGSAPEDDDEPQGTEPEQTEEEPGPIPREVPEPETEEEWEEPTPEEEPEPDTSNAMVPAPEQTEEETSSEENVTEEPDEGHSEVENEIKEFDPDNYTVPEVNEYLAQDDITVDEYNRVIELEMDGQSRAGILNKHSLITEDDDE